MDVLLAFIRRRSSDVYDYYHSEYDRYADSNIRSHIPFMNSAYKKYGYNYRLEFINKDYFPVIRLYSDYESDIMNKIMNIKKWIVQTLLPQHDDSLKYIGIDGVYFNNSQKTLVYDIREDCHGHFKYNA